jgi:hypothetical protein
MAAALVRRHCSTETQRCSATRAHHHFRNPREILSGTAESRAWQVVVIRPA